MKKKLLIFIISYKASFRVFNVVKKIPFKKLNIYKTKLLISDDASRDDTIYYAKKTKNKNFIIIENKKNLGYGGNIKKCLNFSIKKKFDYAVMIHGDGQYDPKYIPNLIKKIEDEKNTGAITGSRTLGGFKNLKKGNMPIYKMIGNIILTYIFNFFMNRKFTDAQIHRQTKLSLAYAGQDYHTSRHQLGTTNLLDQHTALYLLLHAPDLCSRFRGHLR